MQYIFQPALLLLLTASLPSCWTAPLAERACALEYPSYIAFIEKQDPNRRATNGTYFITWKDPTVVSGWPIPHGLDIDSFVQFDHIPMGSWGCQLEMFFPAGYSSLLGKSNGANKLDVKRVLDPIPPNLNWNNAPLGAYLFGTTPVLPTDATLQTDLKVVINSLACGSSLTFRISIPPELADGGVEFWDDNSSPKAGFRLSHNC